jgi:hypothetical protein
MSANTLDKRPGFRRHILVQPGEGEVAVMLEDDIHSLAVILRHDGSRVTDLDGWFERAPWTTCPGAGAKLRETFCGMLLSEVTAKVDKVLNCTHMHDIAVLAAAHAGDAAEILYEMIATDPDNGERLLELRRNGKLVQNWIERDGVLAAPEAVAGKTLHELREWIGSLEGSAREEAGILRWASSVARGRTLPMELQNDAKTLRLRCYTFQPERIDQAELIGDRRDFSEGLNVPLAGLRAQVAEFRRRTGDQN